MDWGPRTAAEMWKEEISGASTALLCNQEFILASAAPGAADTNTRFAPSFFHGIQRCPSWA